jgi:hypothetical protein
LITTKDLRQTFFNDFLGQLYSFHINFFFGSKQERRHILREKCRVWPFGRDVATNVFG